MKSMICIPDDTSGTGQWRCLWPINLLWPTLQIDENLAVTKTFPPDLNYFAIQNAVMIQRWTTPQHRAMFDKVVFPSANGGMCNIVYNIDDCMSADEIPTFNQAWRHYRNPEIQANIKYMLERSDFVVVTNKTLKQYYIDKYGVDENNFIIVPNLLPRSWAFGLYNNALKVNQFENSKATKIRIGIISSSSHFNVAGIRHTKDTQEPVHYDTVAKQYKTIIGDKVVDETDTEEIPDDIDDIADVIRKTSDKFEWISVGASKNESFVKLVEDKLLTVVPQTDILHYMQLVSSLRLSAIVAPIKDTLFNHCKSDIKYLEAAAVGAVLYTPNLKPYLEHVPEKQRWTSSDDLIAKLYALADTSSEEFGKMIHAQYDWLNNPAEIEDGPSIKNWWLDDNIGMWRSVFFMPRKGVKINLSTIVEPPPAPTLPPQPKSTPASYGKNLKK